MKKNTNCKDKPAIIIMAKDLQTIWNLYEDMYGAYKCAAQCSALADMGTEAFTRLKDCGSAPADENTYINYMETILHFARDAKNQLAQLVNKYNGFFQSKSNSIEENAQDLINYFTIIK